MLGLYPEWRWPASGIHYWWIDGSTGNGAVSLLERRKPCQDKVKIIDCGDSKCKIRFRSFYEK
jgi:hypothetical protein